MKRQKQKVKKMKLWNQPWADDCFRHGLAVQRTMKICRRQRGFSLTEVLLAVATLAVGMLFVGGTFLVSVHMTTVASERTTASIAADEAFAKIRIFGLNPSGLAYNSQTPAEKLIAQLDPNLPKVEVAYPSTQTSGPKQYYWSALCRLAADPNDPNLVANPRTVQVTVFVSRKVGASPKFPGGHGWPVRMPVVVTGTAGANVLTIADPDPTVNKETWINDGCTIVDDETGQLYRVRERQPQPGNSNDAVVLDKPWRGPSAPKLVWVVCPPTGGGRYPCVAVYQKVIRF